MGSPFKTADEYLNATGTLHSFAHAPVLTGICIVLVVLIPVAIIAKSYFIKH
jgi:hypothetical protein